MRFERKTLGQTGSRPGGSRGGRASRRMVLTAGLAGAVIVGAAGGYSYYRANSPSQLAARAQLALQQHDPARAMEFLKRAIARHPGGDTGRNLRTMMARALIDAGREADAREYLQQALAEKADDGEALDLLAESHVNPTLRKVREAIKPVSDTAAQAICASADESLGELDRLPASARNLIAQGQLHRLKFLVLTDQAHQASAQLDAAHIAQDAEAAGAAQRQAEAIKGPARQEQAAALAKLTAALQAEPTNAKAAGLIGQYEYQDRHYPEVMAVYGQMKQRGAVPEDLVLAAAQAILADQARQPAHDKRLAEAQGVLEEYLKGHPGSPRSLVSLGDVRLDQGDVGEAVKLGNEAAKEAPGDLAAQILLVNCKLRQNQTQEAIQLITPLTTAHANQAEVWYLLGMARMQEGNSAEAENAFRKAIAVNPGYQAAREALLVQQIQSGNSEGAQLVASDVLHENRYNMTAWGVTVQGLRKRGLADRGRQLLADLAQDPDLPAESKPELVRLLALYGDPQAAGRLLASVQGAGPGAQDKDALVLQAYVAGATGNTTESRALIAQALARDPDDVDLRLEYADLLGKADLPADVRAQLDLAVGSKQGLTVEQSLEVARGYLALRLPSQAQGVLGKLLARQPQQSDALSLERQAEGMLSGGGGGMPVSIASISPADLKSDGARAAAEALQNKRYADALSLSRAALVREKANAALHQIAALALMGMGQAEQAADEAVEAARAAPGATGAYATFVELFSGQDRALQGIGYASRLERINGALGNWAMGRLAAAAGDLDLALKCYHNGLEAADRMTDARDAKDVLYQAVLNAWAQKKDAPGLQREADALASRDAAFAPGIRLLASDQLVSLADRAGARQELQEVTAKLTPSSRVPLVLAVASRWLSLGDEAQARAVMEKQVAGSGQQPELLDAYAGLLAQAQDNARALEVRVKLCQMDPANPIYRVSLAQVQAAGGDIPAAFKTLEDAQKLGATGQEMARAARVRLLIEMGLLQEASQELAQQPGGSGKGGVGGDSAMALAMAQAWARLNKPDEAEKLVAEIPAYAAEYPAGQILRANLDLEAGKAGAAVTLLRQLMGRAPGAASEIAPQLFLAYLREGGEEKVKAAMDLAGTQREGFLAHSPQWEKWTVYAATAAREGGMYEQAIALLNALEPEARKKAALDVALMEILQNKPQEAAKAAQALADTAPAYERTTLALLTAPAPLPPGKTAEVMAGGLPSTVMGALAAMPAEERAGQLGGLEKNPHVLEGDVEGLLREAAKLPDSAGALRQMTLAERLLEAGWTSTALKVLPQAQAGGAGLTMAEVARHQALTDLHRFAEADAVRARLEAEFGLAQGAANSGGAVPPSVRILLAAAAAKEGKFQAALTVLEPLEGLNRPDILTTLATLHEKLGELDEAIALHRRVRQIDPNDIAAANNLAYTLVAAHPTDKAALAEARQAIEYAIGKAPQVQAFQDTLGWIEILSGNAAEGTRTIARALPALRLEPAVHYHLGMGYLRMGDRALARMHLKNVSELVHGQEHVPEIPLASEALKTLASSQ